MQEVKKVEIIIDKLHVKDILDILEQVQVSGYTVIDETEGKGDRGFSCLDLDCVFNSSYILTVCTNEKQLEALINQTQPLLTKVGGICLLTDAKWLSH